MDESVQSPTKYEDGGTADHQMKMVGSSYQKSNKYGRCLHVVFLNIN